MFIVYRKYKKLPECNVRNLIFVLQLGYKCAYGVTVQVYGYRNKAAEKEEASSQDGKMKLFWTLMMAPYTWGGLYPTLGDAPLNLYFLYEFLTRW